MRSLVYTKSRDSEPPSPQSIVLEPHRRTMSSQPESPIIIIGAGIGGLTLGAILRKLSIPFTILERTAELTPVGAGLSLAPNCLAALHQLGLKDIINENSQELRKVRIHRVRGDEAEEWKELNFGLAEKWFGFNVRSIERHSFHRVLYEAAGGEETVRLGCKVEDVVDQPGEEIVVRLEGGEEVRGRMVAAADGIRSVTRRVVSSRRPELAQIDVC